MNRLAIRQHQHRGLWALAALLVAIHITLAFRTQSLEQFNLSVLIWVAVAYQLVERTPPLPVGIPGEIPGEIPTEIPTGDRRDRAQPHVPFALVGTLLLAVMLCKVPQISAPGLFLNLFPLGSALGFAFIALEQYSQRSGVSHMGVPSLLGHYWKELSIIAVLAIPGEKMLARLLELGLMGLTQENLATLTARFVVMVINTLGGQASLQGTEIILANTIVHVDEGCSGAQGMDFLLRLALVALLMFSAHKLQRILIPLSAVAIALIINGIRATIMSYLANQGNMAAFDYWHIGDGSQLFGLAAVLCFVSICYGCLRATPKNSTANGGGPS